MTSLPDSRTERDCRAAELLVALVRAGHKPEPPNGAAELAYALADALLERRHTSEHDRVTARERDVIAAVDKARNALTATRLYLETLNPAGLDDAREGIARTVEALDRLGGAK